MLHFVDDCCKELELARALKNYIKHEAQFFALEFSCIWYLLLNLKLNQYFQSAHFILHQSQVHMCLCDLSSLFNELVFACTLWLASISFFDFMLYAYKQHFFLHCFGSFVFATNRELEKNIKRNEKKRKNHNTIAMCRHNYVLLKHFTHLRK